MQVHYLLIEGIYEIGMEGDIVVSASVDRTLKVWDLRTSSCVRTLEGITFSP